MAKPLSAGSEIDAWCTRCRLDLGHRVVAMVDRRPKRVICLTCNSEHNYRPPKLSGGRRQPASVARTPSPKRTSDGSPHKTRSGLRQLAEWEAHVTGQAAAAFTRYSGESSFYQGELVLHRKFGQGYVLELLDNGKMTVMFRDGPRTLVRGQP